MPQGNLYQTNRGLVNQQDSARLEPARVPRSKFISQWTRKTTFDAGLLYPILVDELLPGDHMTYNVTAYVRMSTPLFPIFDSQRIDTFFFFVPNRLVWDNWVKLMGEQENPDDSIAYTVPRVNSPAGGEAPGNVFDHFGLPVQGQLDPAGVISVNALPFRMLNLIWNEWFRDQNLQDSFPVNKGNGPDNPADYIIPPRNKLHDYFTSALPWPQKFTAPGVPISGGLAAVTGIGFWTTATGADGSGALGAVEYDYPPTTAYAQHVNSKGSGPSNYVAVKANATTGVPEVYADLATASGAISINDLRTAWSIQDLLERDARGGTRYTEKIRKHFGVINPDFRLQRPEYIGGGQSALNITPIAQTAPNSDDTGLGALGAAGTAAGSHTATYAATEHGFVLGFINVRTELSYQQGIPRQWLKSTQYDYYFPSLAGMGEQGIYQMEIWAKGIASDLDIWGYQERYQEYRTRYSEVTGYFRSTTTGSIDQWHLAQEFTVVPDLNGDFIKDNPPMTRILAAGSLAGSMQYLADIMFTRTAVRAIPTHGIPAQLTRF